MHSTTCQGMDCSHFGGGGVAIEAEKHHGTGSEMFSFTFRTQNDKIWSLRQAKLTSTMWCCGLGQCLWKFLIIPSRTFCCLSGLNLFCSDDLLQISFCCWGYFVSACPIKHSSVMSCIYLVCARGLSCTLLHPCLICFSIPSLFPRCLAWMCELASHWIFPPDCHTKKCRSLSECFDWIRFDLIVALLVGSQWFFRLTTKHMHTYKNAILHI